jgi:hypothetical protein
MVPPRLGARELRRHRRGERRVAVARRRQQRAPAPRLGGRLGGRACGGRRRRL